MCFVIFYSDKKSFLFNFFLQTTEQYSLFYNQPISFSLDESKHTRWLHVLHAANALSLKVELRLAVSNAATDETSD